MGKLRKNQDGYVQSTDKLGRVTWVPDPMAAAVRADMSEDVSSDFHQSSQDDMNLDDILHEQFGATTPHVDGGWFLPNVDKDDVTLLTTEDEKAIQNDLNPDIEGSTAHQASLVDNPWEKYDIITSSPYYNNVMHSVVAHHEAHKEKDEEFRNFSKELDDAILLGKECDNAEKIYDAAQEALHSHEEYQVLKNYRDDYLNMVASTLKGSTDHIVDSMEYSDEQMGDMNGMRSEGEFEIGTQQWHEARANSMGGSDIGTLSDKSPYAYSNMKNLWETKVKGVSEEDLASSAQSHSDDITDAISRGNAMEDVIGVLYASSTGKNIRHNKSTWKTEDGLEHLNLDYIEVDDNGKYVGPVEIKNVNDESKWGEPSEGIDGVPSNYRGQLLSQAYHTGAKEGTIVAMMGGSTLKAYHFEMNDDLYKEAEKNSLKAKDFMSKAKEAREEYQKTGVVPPNPYQRPRRQYGVPKKATKTKKINDDKKKYMQQLATLGGTTRDDIERQFTDILGTNTKEWTPDKQEQAYKDIYKSMTPHGHFNGIDLETNGMSPTKGNIIEFGGIAYDMEAGEETARKSQLYSPTPSSMRVNGMGMENVHGINQDMVKNDAPLKDEKNQRELLDYLTSYGTLVAHNDKFEKGFLRAHVKGFAEAESRGDIKFVDTMNISRDTTPTERNRLEDFVTYHGIAYEDAHRATNDVDMMMRALNKWFDNNK